MRKARDPRTAVCTVCGREYMTATNNIAKYCPDCRHGEECRMKKEFRQREKDKIHAFRRSIGLD